MANAVLQHRSCKFGSEHFSICLRKRHGSYLQDCMRACVLARLRSKHAMTAARVEATIAFERHMQGVDTSKTLSDAENAVALAKKAVQAAKYLAALSCNENFISEADILRLERARLSQKHSNFSSDDSVDMYLDDQVTSPSSSTDTDMMEQPKITMHINVERNKQRTICKSENLPVVSKSRLCQEKSTSTCNSECEASVWDDPAKIGRQTKVDNVAVRSTRRSKRPLKRKTATLKAKNITNLAADGVDLLGRPSRPRRVPIQYSSADPVRSFLINNGSATPKLLSAAEEVELSHKIQDLLGLEAVKEKLKKQIGRDPTLAEWAKAVGMKTCHLSERLVEGQQSKDTMIRCNLRLVISVAKKYQGKGLTLQELIQEGSMGLIRGCEKFDPERGFKFSTYAHWWIRQAVSRAILQKSRLVRLPVHLFDTLVRVRRARRSLQQKFGRPASDSEVAKSCGITMEKLKVVYRASASCRSMDAPIGDEMNLYLSEIVPDTSLEPLESRVAKDHLKEDLNMVLRTLKPREIDVVKLRFGLEDGKSKTLKEIGKMFELTRERIRQIECKAMKKLKQPERNAILRGPTGDGILSQIIDME